MLTASSGVPEGAVIRRVSRRRRVLRTVGSAKAIASSSPAVSHFRRSRGVSGRGQERRPLNLVRKTRRPAAAAAELRAVRRGGGVAQRRQAGEAVEAAFAAVGDLDGNAGLAELVE